MTIQLPLRPLHLASCQNCGTRCTVAVHSVQVFTVHWEEQCAVCWGMDSWCVTLLTGRRSSEAHRAHHQSTALCTVYTNTEHYIHCTLTYIIQRVALQIQ